MLNGTIQLGHTKSQTTCPPSPPICLSNKWNYETSVQVSYSDVREKMQTIYFLYVIIKESLGGIHLTSHLKNRTELGLSCARK